MRQHNGLTLQHVGYSYATRPVLENISLNVRPGQVVALVGSSGCGKTTLLRLCAGLLQVQNGTLENQFRHTVMLFQQSRLLPWKTTLDNIALGLKSKGIAALKRRSMAHNIGLELGLDALSLSQYPHQLSGGMQSRVALARALVLKPDLLLLDEPFSALDIGLKAHMHNLLLQQQLQRSLSVLMITHDLMEAVTLANTIIVMAANPGKLVYTENLTIEPAKRTPEWVYKTTAELLSKTQVQQAFNLC